MKLQISDQQWRVRVNEDELQRLREGHVLTSTSALADDAVLRFVVELVPAPQASVGRDGGSWKFSLPAAAIDAYVARLPCREGVDFVLPGGTGAALQLTFEVDVRDSVRRRGARPRRP